MDLTIPGNVRILKGALWIWFRCKFCCKQALSVPSTRAQVWDLKGCDSIEYPTEYFTGGGGIFYTSGSSYHDFGLVHVPEQEIVYSSIYWSSLSTSQSGKFYYFLSKAESLSKIMIRSSVLILRDIPMWNIYRTGKNILHCYNNM